MTMFSFGVGSALPLLLLGMLSRETLVRWRGKMMSFGKSGKMLLGGVLLFSGLLILLRLDKALEGWLLQILPQSVLDLAARF